MAKKGSFYWTNLTPLLKHFGINLPKSLLKPISGNVQKVVIFCKSAENRDFREISENRKNLIDPQKSTFHENTKKTCFFLGTPKIMKFGTCTPKSAKKKGQKT
jgi:hypothetical protein